MRPKKTILYVDNNDHVLSIRKVMLETRGYRVITSTKPREALEIFKQGGVDIVLSDLAMPECDGSELIAQIKTLSPETPAILISGKVRICENETSADVFLSKGNSDAAALLERIRLLLVRKRGSRRSVPEKTTSLIAAS